jgi:hypothetical protein
VILVVMPVAIVIVIGVKDIRFVAPAMALLIPIPPTAI